MTTEKRAVKTKFDFRCSICRFAIGQFPPITLLLNNGILEFVRKQFNVNSTIAQTTQNI